MVRAFPFWLVVTMLTAPSLRARPARAAHRASGLRVVRRVRVTAYCMGPCRRCGTHGCTYTGTHTLRGAAVARHGLRRVLPLGSRLYVPGYGPARIDDVGGRVGRGQIDLRFRTHRQAAHWGTRWARVLVQLPPAAHANRQRRHLAHGPRHSEWVARAAAPRVRLAAFR